MGIDNKDELDDELVKSLERLVEEETSVAKAFVDNQKESSAENTAAKDSQDTDIEMGKTKVIPKVTTDMLTKSDDDVQKTGVYNVDEVRDNIRNIPVKNSDSGVNLDVDLEIATTDVEYVEVLLSKLKSKKISFLKALHILLVYAKNNGMEYNKKWGNCSVGQRIYCADRTKTWVSRQKSHCRRQF